MDHSVAGRVHTLPSPARVPEPPDDCASAPQIGKIELVLEDLAGKIDRVLERAPEMAPEDLAAEEVEACMARLNMSARKREKYASLYLDARQHRGAAREVSMLALHCRLESDRILGRAPSAIS